MRFGRQCSNHLKLGHHQGTFSYSQSVFLRRGRSRDFFPCWFVLHTFLIQDDLTHDHVVSISQSCVHWCLLGSCCWWLVSFLLQSVRTVFLLSESLAFSPSPRHRPTVTRRRTCFDMHTLSCTSFQIQTLGRDCSTNKNLPFLLKAFATQSEPTNRNDTIHNWQSTHRKRSHIRIPIQSTPNTMYQR